MSITFITSHNVMVDSVYLKTTTITKMLFTYYQTVSSLKTKDIKTTLFTELFDVIYLQ